MLIHNLEVAAITEFEEGFDRVAGGVAGIGREEQLEAAVGLVHHKIGVPLVRPTVFLIKPLGPCTFFFTMASPPPTGLRNVQAASEVTGASNSKAVPLTSEIKRDMGRVSGLVGG